MGEIIYSDHITPFIFIERWIGLRLAKKECQCLKLSIKSRERTSCEWHNSIIMNLLRFTSTFNMRNSQFRNQILFFSLLFPSFVISRHALNSNLSVVGFCLHSAFDLTRLIRTFPKKKVNTQNLTKA